MTYISLRDIIDDILLLVRNNNISESEDLSRAQIELWVKAWRRQLWRERRDQLKDQLKLRDAILEDWLNLTDEEFFKVKEVMLELDDTEDETLPPNTKRSKETLDGILDNSWRSILAIHDRSGENIQYMNHIRRHYQYNRKYTFGELTAYYSDDKHIYVQGLTDGGQLKYIWVLALYEVDDDDNDEGNDEDDIKIPSWMVPLIKQRIMQNELAFMLNRPSDDSNNATLASVKPHGPQDQEE